jgi:hypothetical protein
MGISLLFGLGDYSQPDLLNHILRLPKIGSVAPSITSKP